MINFFKKIPLFIAPFIFLFSVSLNSFSLSEKNGVKLNNSDKPIHKIKIIADFELVYNFFYRGINVGKIYYSFKKFPTFNLKNYQFSSDFLTDFYFHSVQAQPTGLAKLFVDSWVVNDWLTIYKNRLVNLSNSIEFKGSKKKEPVHLQYDLINAKTKNIVSNQVFTARFPNLNNYTLYLSLATDLLNLKELKLNQIFSYFSSSKTKSKIKTFKYIKQEKIKIDLGEFDTKVFKLLGKDKQITLSLSEKLSYLPVKIEMGSNNKVKFSYELIHFSFNTKKTRQRKKIE